MKVDKFQGSAAAIAISHSDVYLCFDTKGFAKVPKRFHTLLLLANLKRFEPEKFGNRLLGPTNDFLRPGAGGYHLRRCSKSHLKSPASKCALSKK
ncbi:MAG: hypothetical protein JWN45_3395 [Acidobacteriaceae bacterium]|nr:hypothetical protein [Acidobacteriaceae bacterium]